VTRGALLRGIEGGIVETRIIRAAYGIMSYQNWDPEKHEKGEMKRLAAKNKYPFQSPQDAPRKPTNSA